MPFSRASDSAMHRCDALPGKASQQAGGQDVAGRRERGSCRGDERSDSRRHDVQSVLVQ